MPDFELHHDAVADLVEAREQVQHLLLEQEILPNSLGLNHTPIAELHFPEDLNRAAHQRLSRVYLQPIDPAEANLAHYLS